VDFTREPIIETIVTPKEGYKLAIRSSKTTEQEEYLVEAVEIVSFGEAFFFRSLEKPKAFLVPVSDYEVVEVREARMALKSATIERNVKIAGGKESKESPSKSTKETNKEEEEEFETPAVPGDLSSPIEEVKGEIKGDKKREKRRHSRRRRREDEKEEKENASPETTKTPREQAKQPSTPDLLPSPSALSSLLQPPPTLISETIGRYRQSEVFKGAFFLSEEEQYKPHDKVLDVLNDEETEEEGASAAETFSNLQESSPVSENREDSLTPSISEEEDLPFL